MRWTEEQAREKWPANSQRKLYADLCKRSFYHFCLYGFGYGRNPEGYWFTERVHKPICDWLQKHAEDWFARRARKEQGRMKLIIVVPRTHGKTTTVTKAFQTWLHLFDRNLSTVTDSEDAQKAQEFMKGITEVIAGNDPWALFTWMYGNWYDKKRLWQSSQVVHGWRDMMSKTEPSFGTTSVNTGKTGYHPDAVFLDDPVSYEKLKETGTWNEQCHTHIGSLIPVIKPNGAFILVGTRYLDNDPIGRMMMDEGVNELCGMPMYDERLKISPKGQWAVYHLQAEIGTDPDGTPIPLLPEAWSGQELLDYKRSRPVHYAAQMMNEPAVGEHNPVTQSMIDRMWIEKDNIPRNVVLSIHLDTAFRYAKRVARSDHSVIQVWAHSCDGSGWVYYLEGIGSPRWRVEDFSQELVKIVQRYRQSGYHIRCITDEMEVGGKEGTYKAYLESQFHAEGMPHPPIILLRRYGQGQKKEDRIRDAANYWVDGKVWLTRGSKGCQELISQMTRIGVSAHDDYADAAADIFHPQVYYATRLSIDPDGGEGMQYYPQRPFDDVLQGGGVIPPGEHGQHVQITNDVARSMYDTYSSYTDPEGHGGHMIRPVID